MAHRRSRHRLDATCAQLWSALCDPDRVTARGDAHTTLESHALDGEDGVVITTRTDIPLDWLPSAVRGRSLPGAAGGSGLPSVRRVEHWHRAATGLECGMDLQIIGVDAVAAATLNAADAAGGRGCEVAVDLDLSVRVPMVGGLVERAVLPRIEESLARELAALADGGLTTAP